MPVPAHPPEAQRRGPEGNLQFGIDPTVATRMARQIADTLQTARSSASSSAAATFWRGLSAAQPGHGPRHGATYGMIRHRAHALTLQDALEQEAVQTRVMTAFEMRESPSVHSRRAIRHMEKGRVVILAAGTGNPYFTSDTPPRCARSSSTTTRC